MGRKSVLAVVGALLAGVVLSGCETGYTHYDHAQTYMPPLGGTNTAVAQGQNFYNSVKPTYSYSSGVMPAVTLKPESGPGSACAPIEVTASVQQVNMPAATGTGAGTGTGTPMVSITLPAVKVLVPLTGAYAYVPGSGAPVAPVANPVNGETVLGGQSTLTLNPVPSEEGGRASLLPPATNPSVEMTPPSPPSPSTSAYLPPISEPKPASAANPVPSARVVILKPADEQPMPVLKPVTMEPPPPSWPNAGSAPSESASGEMPPPPPPIHRGSAQAGGKNPSYP